MQTINGDTIQLCLSSHRMFRFYLFIYAIYTTLYNYKTNLFPI